MEERLSFYTEWYEPCSDSIRPFSFFFYPKDGSVEMHDLRWNKKFLKRTKYDGLCQEDLYIGNQVIVFSRELRLISYADQYTANKLASKSQRTLALIKPDAATKIGDVLEWIYSSDLKVTKAKMTQLSQSQAADFYAEHQSKPFFNNLVQFLSSGPVVAMELMGDDVISIWRSVLGPVDSAAANEEVPQTAHAQFGTDGVRNVGHGSDSVAAAERELEFFFPSTTAPGPSNTAICFDSTCCIIKPHAVSEGLTGKILNSIAAAGFEISALQMFNVYKANAQEFFELYKGVVQEYTSMVDQLCSGSCMVLEIRGIDAVTKFRQFCGPADPEVARLLFPASLRALYGTDKVKNAVHCTDLPENGLLEVQYFFKILDQYIPYK